MSCLEPCFWHIWAKIYRFSRGTRQTARQFNGHFGRDSLSSSDDSSRQKETVAKSFIRSEGRSEVDTSVPPPVISSLMTSHIYLTYISPPNNVRPVLRHRAQNLALSLDGRTHSSSPLLLTPTHPSRTNWVISCLFSVPRLKPFPLSMYKRNVKLQLV